MLDIAITGTGIVSGLGCGSRKYHDAMMAGEIAIREAPWKKSGDASPNWWAIVRDFNPRDWMDEKIESGTDMFSQFALAAARQALDEAGLDALDPERTGVVHGTSMGGTRALMKAQYMLDEHGPQQIPRKTEILIYPNMAASQIAMKYSLHGPCLTLTTACASSLDALGTAAHMIASDRADVLIAGGTDGGFALPGGLPDGDFTPALYYTSTAYGMVAQSKDPRRSMMPFDRKRSGIVVGEGSAMFVLERGDRARARGANILGYIRGYGSLADAYHPSTPDPSGKWEARAMEMALADFRLQRWTSRCADCSRHGHAQGRHRGNPGDQPCARRSRAAGRLGQGTPRTQRRLVRRHGPHHWSRRHGGGSLHLHRQHGRAGCGGRFRRRDREAARHEDRDNANQRVRFRRPECLDRRDEELT